MATLNHSQIQALWINAGGGRENIKINDVESLPLPVVMSAIAMAESTGRTDAINPGLGAGGKPTNEFSVGIWQINTLVHKVFTADQLKNPDNNAKEAVRIFKLQGLRAWGAFIDKRYLGFLGAAKEAWAASGGVIPSNSDFSNFISSDSPITGVSNGTLIIGVVLLFLLLRRS